VLAVTAFAAAIYVGLTLEPAASDVVPVDEFLRSCGLLCAAGLLLLLFGARQRLPLCLDAAADLRAVGLVTTLWRYGEEEARSCVAPTNPALARWAAAVAAKRPNLVAVQSESFFDPRPLYAGIRREVLGEFDSLCDGAACHGSLQVAAWGANTVRSEFAFLAGLASERLGINRFNPYRKLVRQGVTTVASVLRQQGYRTVCIHPYSAGFYSRDRVYPLLGFDEFVDERAFVAAPRCGPYVSDRAVVEHVRRVLREASSQPLFVFVITMENHGPLHLEQALPDDIERGYLTPPPPGCDDLTVYLRHLRNADQMAGGLRESIAEGPGEGVLCWFGDHVPIMPKVYHTFGAPDGSTRFVIWRKGEPSAARAPISLPVDRLAERVLQVMASG
jgi:phosphoglycerol transferase MdoB-like AlkP superfamily enzyme